MKNNLFSVKFLFPIFVVFFVGFLLFSATDLVYARAGDLPPVTPPATCLGVPMPTGIPTLSPETTPLGVNQSCTTNSCGNMWCHTQDEICTWRRPYGCTPTGWSMTKSCVIVSVTKACDPSTCTPKTGTPPSCPVPIGGPSAQYSLSLDPSVRSIQNTDTTTYTVTVYPVSGMASAEVDLSLTGCPSNTTCTLDNNGVVMMDSTEPPQPKVVNLLITPNPSIPSNTYTLDITGTYTDQSNTTITQTASSELDVSYFPPCTPLPLQSATIQAPTPLSGYSTFNILIDYGQRLNVNSPNPDIVTPNGQEIPANNIFSCQGYPTWVGNTTVAKYTCFAPAYGGGTNIYHMYTGIINYPPPGTNICSDNYHSIGYVTVSPNPPQINLWATPSSPPGINKGDNITLSWSVTGADSCTASGSHNWAGNGGVYASANDPFNDSGTLNNLQQTETFSLDCTNSTGTNHKETTVTVNTPPPANTITINSNASVNGGYIKSSDGFIDCGNGRPNNCSHSYNKNDLVILTEYPNSIHWLFLGWTSNPDTPNCNGGLISKGLSVCSFNVTQSTNVSVKFLAIGVYSEF